MLLPHELKYFQLLESFDAPLVEEPAVINEEAEVSKLDEIIEDLSRVLVKIETMQTPGNGEFADGFEEARMRISEMIDNVLSAYSERPVR